MSAETYARIAKNRKCDSRVHCEVFSYGNVNILRLAKKFSIILFIFGMSKLSHIQADLLKKKIAIFHWKCLYKWLAIEQYYLKGHCIEIKYYADCIHSGLTPPGQQ